jgi:NADH-quinone oxidoreductase subunit J
MNLDMILFYFFSSILLLSSLLIIVEINSIYSILLLVLSFVIATSLLFLLESEFMALIFIIIYVGAISVLFLFVIIMLNIKITSSIKDIVKYFPIGNFLGLVFLIEILMIIFDNYKINYYKDSFLFNFNINWFYKLDYITDLKALGQILYSYYMPQFLIAGSILLIAVIGAVVLTLNSKKMDVKIQETFRQVSR